MKTKVRTGFARAARLAAVVLIFGAARPSAAANDCGVEGVERIVAIGDVHGAYGRFVEILRETGLVDTGLHWAGGQAHLVQLGDVVDRGDDSRKALDLLRRLETEAAEAGGAVHALLGNHEVMRMQGQMHYVSPGEYAAFVTPASEETRERFLRKVDKKQRDQVRAETPLGRVEMDAAFGPDGEYGRWLRGHPAVVMINRVLFLHGGVSPTQSARTCEAVNAEVRRELTRDPKSASAEGENLVTREDGPLWYRRLVQEPAAFEATVDEILARQGARAIVVAHTVAPEGRIVPHFRGKVFQIDTGMNAAYVPTGRASALEIRGDTFTAMYSDRREVLRSPAY